MCNNASRVLPMVLLWSHTSRPYPVTGRLRRSRRARRGEWEWRRRRILGLWRPRIESMGAGPSGDPSGPRSGRHGGRADTQSNISPSIALRELPKRQSQVFILFNRPCRRRQAARRGAIDRVARRPKTKGNRHRVAAIPRLLHPDVHAPEMASSLALLASPPAPPAYSPGTFNLVEVDEINVSGGGWLGLCTCRNPHM